MLATSCATPRTGQGGTPSPNATANAPASGDVVDFAGLGTRTPAVAPVAGSTPMQTASLADMPANQPAAELAGPEIYRATAPPLAKGTTGAVAGSAVQTTNDGITLNFANTDVHQVIDIVLGETLGLNYSIDPKVKGTITARTVRPLSREDVLATLESVLAMNDIAIVPKNGVYQIIPMEDTNKNIPSAQVMGSELGFGMHILPLRYVSAHEIANLMQPYIPPGRTIQVLDGKNIILFTGTSSEAHQLEDLADTFDVDWLRGRTFALLPVTYADANTIASELSQVFGVEPNGPLNGVVGFLAISRLNAVLAMSTEESYVDEAKTWVQRLDREATGAGRTTYVYRVQNARAQDLAKVLQSLYSNANGEEQAPVSPNQTPASFSRPAEPDSTLSNDINTPAGMASATNVPGVGSAEGPSGVTGATGPLPEPNSTSAQSSVSSFQTDNGIRIVADDSQNAILVSCNREQYQQVQSVLRQLDTVPLQVEIEATIAEVTLNDELKYGLQWYFREGHGKVTLSNSKIGSVASEFPGFSFVVGADNANVVLDALSQITKVRVISSPTLLVLDNQRATLQVGDEVPIATSSAVSTIDTNAPVVNQIEFRNTGVILEVTPRVNSNGQVMLDISQEVSDVVPTTTSNLDSPTVRQRKLASAIVVNSGETVALGGLIQDSSTKDHSGVPLLSEIPVLGNAFKTTDDTRVRTELVVLITPRISRNSEETRALTDAMRARLGALQPLEKRLDDPKATDETGALARLRHLNDN